MTLIKVLPGNLINQIAAGEVVERPASVVKELLENSLDAGATRITVEVEEGGSSLLRISDNGSGMEREDARMSFERHATSKISSEKDLAGIMTLGFRGEAIASIASVSEVEMETKLRGAEAGTVIGFEGGEMKRIEDHGCPDGTVISVRRLFYNTPARKKYLKSGNVEYRHIVEVVSGIALANPDVAFKLINDGREVFNLTVTDNPEVRISGVLGSEIGKNLIPVYYGGGAGISLSGFIGKPVISRSNRKNQFLYVNGRQVNSSALSFAVKQAYYSLLPKEKYPVFILFLSLDPLLVDVNVHPRKLEVRFSNERDLFSIFYRASMRSLEKNVLTPDFVFSKHQNPGQTLKDCDPSAENGAPILSLPDSKKHPPYGDKPLFSGQTLEREDGISAYTTDKEMSESLEKAMWNEGVQSVKDELLAEKGTSLVGQSLGEVEPLAQMADSYILCRQGDNLVIMDQHAAHERIRYEEILADFEGRSVAVQGLLAPEVLELSLAEKVLFEENKELFKQMGFEIESFGGNSFSVYAVPSYLVKANLSATIKGLLDDFNDNSVKGDFQRRKERALTFAACRSAVKFGDRLSVEEQKSLCKKLMEAKLPYSCPHGRPTMIKMSFAELEKKFGREY